MGFFRDARDLKQQETAELMSSGVVGQALINSIADTGTTVNENPQVLLDLTVTLPGQAPYPATLTQIVSRVAIGSFQPGAIVPVRVSPSDPQSLMIAWPASPGASSGARGAWAG